MASKRARKDLQGRSGFFCRDGEMHIVGMTEYKGDVVYRLVGWLKRCLALRRKRSRVEKDLPKFLAALPKRPLKNSRNT